MLVTEIKAIKTQTHPGMGLVPNAWPGAGDFDCFDFSNLRSLYMSIEIETIKIPKSRQAFETRPKPGEGF